MCVKWEKVWICVHATVTFVYVFTGALQLAAGLFFILTLPTFKLASNIWAGAWNMLVGIGGGWLACFGKSSNLNRELMLYLTISVIAVNVINLVISEFLFFVTDDLADLTGNNKLRKLLRYVRELTLICALVAIGASFLSSQISFCLIQRLYRRYPRKLSNEHASDIDYVIPKLNKSISSLDKTNNNPTNHDAYAQSWVFSETNRDASMLSDKLSPIQPALLEDRLKLHDNVIVIKSPNRDIYNENTILRVKSAHARNASIGIYAPLKLTVDYSKNELLPNRLSQQWPYPDNDTCNRKKSRETFGSKTNREIITNPMVHLDDCLNDRYNDRLKIDCMKSFSRSTSPCVLSTRSSLVSLNVATPNDTHFEYLREKLADPNTYRLTDARAKLNTSITNARKIEKTISNCSTMPVSCKLSPQEVVERAQTQKASEKGEKVQYASLMYELEQHMQRKKTRPPPSVEQQTIKIDFSNSNKTTTTNSSACASSHHSNQSLKIDSDAEFSKELEAALQLIQDLDSPTSEKPTGSSKTSKNSDKVKHWRRSVASEGDQERTLTQVDSIPDVTSPLSDMDSSCVKSHGKKTILILNACESQNTSGYSSPHNSTPTPSLVNPGDNCQALNASKKSSNSSLTSDLDVSTNDVPGCTIRNTNNTAIISLHDGKSTLNRPKSITVVNITNDHVNGNVVKNNSLKLPDNRTSMEDYRTKTIERFNSLKLTDKPNGVWNVKSLLRKKKSVLPPKLPPELESAVYKSESLAYLSDIELLARHERNKEIQRQIEKRVQHQLGHAPTESNC